MYVIYDGRSYIGATANNTPSCVGNRKKALTFDTLEKANNYINNIKATMRKFPWQAVEIGGMSKPAAEVRGEVSDVTLKRKETVLERSGFDIVKFFNSTIETVSQLRDYAKNMRHLEQEYNDKIMDTRHYMRDPRTKLNAIQLQRLAQFKTQLEKERWECKSNYLIAEIFLEDFNRIEDPIWIEEINKIKRDEYKPRCLTFEMLDEIVGKVKK